MGLLLTPLPHKSLLTTNPIRESNFMRGAGKEADWINKLSYLERETTKEKQEQH